MSSCRGFARNLLVLAVSLCPRVGAETSAPADDGASAASGFPTSTEAVERCVLDHERARLLKVERKWREARVAADRCASEACPLSLKADCRDWLLELANLFASVVIIVEGEPEQSEKVRISMDGKPLESNVSRAPLLLPPGSYTLTFELPPHRPMIRQVVLEEGEKNRVVRVRFPGAPPPSPAPEVKPRAVSQPRFSEPVPSATWALLGGASLAGTASTLLFLSAVSERNQALEDCAPSCGPSVRDSIEAKLLLADVTAVSALTFAALATYTYFRRPRVPETSVERSVSTLRVGLAPKTLSVRVEGAF